MKNKIKINITITDIQDTSWYGIIDRIDRKDFCKVIQEWYESKEGYEALIDLIGTHKYKIRVE